jgi:Rad3-related DNA helicase
MDHGEQIIDTLGQEVDRIERNIKVRVCSLIVLLVSAKLSENLLRSIASINLVSSTLEGFNLNNITSSTLIG